MRTISYQIAFNEESEMFDVYEFETRHATTGDEHEFHYAGSFETRHEAKAFIEEIIA